MQTLNLHAASRRLVLALLVATAGPTLADAALATASHAPHSLVGLDLNLQIERTQGPAAASYPNQGAMVRRLMPQGQWTSLGAGGPNHREAHGVSQWHRSADHSWIETSTDASGAPAASTFTYHFESPRHGRWSWDINRGQAQLSGSFTTTPSQPSADQRLAPATNAGLHVPLIIKSAVSTSLPPGSFPSAGLVLQTYSADGTLTFQGFGPGNLNSKGTYTYRRVSANTAVEETLQTSDFFTLPYTMVYTFKTANSGVWYQNFADGLIRFSGTFDTFPK